MAITTASAPATGANPAPAVRKRRRLRTFTRGDKVILVLMVGIPALFEAVLVWLPALLSVGLSFTNARLDISQPGGMHLVGLSNYRFVAQSYPPFVPAIEHNVIWLLFLTFIATPLGLLLAVLLDFNLRGSWLYQSVLFIPVMLSLALVGIIWQLMYSSDSGLINLVLGTAGKPGAIDWFSNSQINLWAALIATSWKHVGYIMILYLAGLKGVEVLDACREVTGHPIPAVERDRRPGDPPTLVASNIRGRELLGWTPRLDLHRLVADAWAFLRDGTAPTP